MSLAIALVLLWAPARMAQTARQGVSYLSWTIPPPEGSFITPLPDFNRPTHFSIAPSYQYFPPMVVPRGVRPEVTSSDWEGRTLTLKQGYFQGLDYLPLTVDAEEFFSWRSQRSREFDYRNSRLTQRRTQMESGGSGLRVNIPIKSRTVESLFGEGGAGLQVSGSRSISFAGTSNWTDGGGLNRSQTSKFPTLRMEQNFRFNILGTIGSKIFVKVNQDSRVNLPLANRLELRFRGSEDDVIKSIEAGNTTLSLPGAQMLRYSSQVRGLFGIKTEAQVGPFRFTGIASQEKANTERATIEAGSRDLTVRSRDYQFWRWKIFDLGLASHFESPDDEIIEHQLYIETSSNSENFQKARMLLDPRPDPNDPAKFRDTTVNEGTIDGVTVELVDPERYTLFSPQRTLILDQVSVRQSDFMGIWMKVRRSNGTTYEIGDLVSNDFFVLKILKMDHEISPNETGPERTVDSYEWRNVYRIPSQLGIDFENPDIESVTLKVFKGGDGEEEFASNLDVLADGTPYIEILGLDQVGSSEGPDGRADMKSQLFDWDRRLFVTPARKPFNTSEVFAGRPELEEKTPGIYDMSKPEREKSTDSKYYFEFTSSLRSNSIQLTGANIVDGSEVVTANGVTLVRGQDYNVMGNSVQLISERATDPGANVQVNYEVAPLFTVEKKTLLGGTLQFARGQSFKAGLTALFKSDKATTRKPKVGQETTKMFAYDFNTSFTLRPNFLTGLLDALPLIRSKGPSSINISGEIARSHPNPNIDGEAFIDDFEGSRQEVSLSPIRSRWRLTSIPAQLDPDRNKRAHIYWYNPDASDAIPSSDVYNEERTTANSAIRPLTVVIEPDDIRIDTTVLQIVSIDTLSVDSIIDTSTIVDSIVIDTTVNVLSADTVFSPNSLSFYDPQVSKSRRDLFKLVGSRNNNPQDEWAGIVFDFPTSVKNQTDAELLEVRLRIRQKQPGGFIHFDLGSISEDAIPNGVLDREDPQLTEWASDFTRDIGLDLMTDDDEVLWFSDVTDFLIDPLDPSRDNFPFDQTSIVTTSDPIPLSQLFPDVRNEDDLKNLRKVNGTENNHFDVPLNGRVDSEDRQQFGNGSIDVANDYFSFRASLDTLATEDNFFVEGSQQDNAQFPDAPRFITLRIPIKELWAVDTIINNAIWTDIKNVRVWFDSLLDTTMIEIADMALVSSNWNDTLKYLTPERAETSPSVFTVSVISDATDGLVYQSPGNVTGNVDQLNDITEREQSLRLEYQDLIYGDTGIVSKPQSSVNYMTYGSLKMFVHGDNSLGSNHRINYAFRIGSDSLNYYEFREELIPGWEGNEVVLDFNELTGLKDEAIQKELVDSTGRLNSGDLHPVYRVVGQPTLRAVRYIASVVMNADPADTLLGVSGEVWINELRVSDVRNDIGTAARATVSGNVGDFISSYSASVSYTDPFYRDPARGSRTGGALGSGRSDLSYNIALNVAADKFFAPSLGASFPVRMSFSRTTSTPLLVTARNSDIVLPEERRVEERTISESRGFSIRESFRKNTKNPIFTALLNNLSSHFNYTRNESTSPTVPSSISENYDAGVTYNVNTIPQPPKIPLFFMFKPVPFLNRLAETRLNLAPQNLNLRNTFRRNLRVTQNNERGSLTTQFTRILTSDFRTSARFLSNLTSNFSMGFQSDLRDPNSVNISLNDFRLGKLTRLQQSLSTDYSPEVFKWLTHKFSASASYTENRRENAVDLNQSPGDSLLEPLDITQSLRASVSGTFDLKGFFGGPSRARQDVRRDVRQRQIEQARKLRERRTREARGDTATADSSGAETAEKEEEDKGPSGPWVGARVFDFGRSTLFKLTSIIDPLSGSIEKNQSRSQNGLRYRPGSAFRFGFTDAHDVPFAPVRRPNNSFSQGTSWRGSSGVTLFGGGITTKVDVTVSKGRSFPTTGGGSETLDKTWPRLSISIRQIRGFEKVWGLRKLQGLLNSFIRRFGPQTSYSRRTSERKDLANNVITGSSETIDRTPLLAITIPVKRSININARLETSKSTRQSFNLINGKSTGASRDKSTTVRVGTQYSFRSPQGIKLPIFGRIRIQSNVSMRLDALKRFSQAEVQQPRQEFEVTNKNESFNVTFNTTYSFSSQVRGGMTVTWTDTENGTRRTHTREVRIFAEMSF